MHSSNVGASAGVVGAPKNSQRPQARVDSPRNQGFAPEVGQENASWHPDESYRFARGLLFAIALSMLFWWAVIELVMLWA